MAKKAIVMGATSGIGMEVAKLLAAKGWQVGIAGRRIERLQALISQSGITCYQQIDVTSPNAPALPHLHGTQSAIYRLRRSETADSGIRKRKEGGRPAEE